MKFIKAIIEDVVCIYNLEGKNIKIIKEAIAFGKDGEDGQGFSLDLTDDEFEGFQEEFTKFLEDDRKNVFEVTKWLKQ